MVDFESEYKSLYRPLCLFALQYTNQIDDAEDVVQQVFEYKKRSWYRCRLKIMWDSSGSGSFRI